MANILQFTERLDNTDYWVGTATVTANTDAAPVDFGSNAGRADTVEDNSVVAVQFLNSLNETIPNDSSNWFASAFVKKDAVTTRFPTISVQMSGGSGSIFGVSINTSAGTVVEAAGTFPPTTAKGVIDFDANYWRVWFRMANDSSGNTQARMFVNAAPTNTHGGDDLALVTGSVVVIGVNLTNSNVLLPYQANPAYTQTVGLLRR